MSVFGISIRRKARVALSFFLFSSLSAHALTLAEAEQRALANNPLLAASTAAVEAAQGDAQQAGRWANPELAFSRESLGNSLLTGLDGPTHTWQLSQRLDWGRTARRNEGLAAVQVAVLRREQEKRLLLARVRTVWISVLAAQQEKAAAAEMVQLGREAQRAVSLQVQAGKVSPIALNRMTVALAEIQRREQQSLLKWQAARQQLAQLQGLASPDFADLPGAVTPRQPLPERAFFDTKNSVAVQLSEAETQSGETGRQVAAAARLPAITLSIGQTRFEEVKGESTWQMGIALPIPVFDRNKDARDAAAARWREANFREQAARLSLQAEVDALYAEASMLAEQLDTWEQRILPASEEAYQVIRKGYGYGRFALLDVLDAQRSFLDSRFTYWEVLVQYHEKINRLYALVAKAEEN